MFTQYDLEVAQMLEQVYLAFALVSVSVNSILFAFSTIRKMGNEISV